MDLNRFAAHRTVFHAQTDSRLPLPGEEGTAQFVSTYQALRTLPRRVRRRLQRQWKQSLAGVALLLALGTTPTLAATTITVPAGDTAALIQAIIDANSEVPPYDGPDTIELTPSTFAFTAPYATTDNALPVIDSAITIAGNGSTIQRDATAVEEFRLLEVARAAFLTLQDTTVRGGIAPRAGAGGGVVNFLGTLELERCTVIGNAARTGGGMYVETLDGGDVEIRNSTVSGNTASGDGGGVGSLSFDGSTVRLLNSTVSGNTAGGQGGGVYSLNFSNTTTGLRGMLIAGNTATDSGDEMHGERRGSGTLLVDAYNLFGHSGVSTAGALSNVTPGASDLTATADGTIPTALTAILDSTLQDNGGPTFTHALPTGSPAIDAADAVDFPATDQRGVTRPQGAGPDIGAVEVAVTTVSIDDLLAFFDQAVADGTLTGVGSGQLAALRLKAMRLALVLADQLVEQEQITWACAELQLAHDLTDGQPRPRDLVTGTAAPALALLLTDVRTALGCAN